MWEIKEEFVRVVGQHAENQNMANMTEAGESM